MNSLIAILSCLLLALVQGDQTISGNTVGDIVTVNVEVKADIENSIHQHYDNFAPSLDGTVFWDRIQELIGQLPQQSEIPEGDDSSMPVDTKPKPDILKPWIQAVDTKRNVIVKQMYEFLSAHPEVWEDLQQLMKNLPKNMVTPDNHIENTN